MGKWTWVETDPPKRKRHYSPPKFSWAPPALTTDVEHNPIPRAFARGAFIAYSDAALGRIHSRFAHGGGIISILLERLSGPPEPTYERPPDLPADHYSVDVG